MSLYCHVHWTQFWFPCSFNLKEWWRPGLKSILKRSSAQEKLAALKDADLVYIPDMWRLEPELTHEGNGAAQCLWCLILLQGSLAKDLPFAAASPFQLCHLSAKLLGQCLISCPHTLGHILLFSWPCTSMLCCYGYVREAIDTVVRVKPFHQLFLALFFAVFSLY